MALRVAPPRDPLSDEEEGGAAVFESTAANPGGVAGSRRCATTLHEVSNICAPAVAQTNGREMEQRKVGPDERGSGEEDGSTERVRVYLRIRPLMDVEKERGEEQGCVCVQDEETLLLRDPRVSQSVHKFTFTQILGPGTTQQECFDRTMKETVRDVLQGESRLLYTYGVSNSGKTYTVQGTGGEAGLLPRALVSVFGRLQGRLYDSPDLKPALREEVRRLTGAEVRAEEARRDSLLKEEDGSISQNSRRRGGASVSGDSGIGGVSSGSSITTELEDLDSVCLDGDALSHSGGEGPEDGVRFSVWVSFFEIYNEFLYDLLEAPPTPPSRKRATLRLCDDRHGNPYVKDLTWVQVRSAEEAWKVLRIGRRNQSFASTHLNLASSRSHSIFSLRLLHIHPEGERGHSTQTSELTVCDLAGSERCKDQRSGERMKEANNINTSLHTLGRCITALRHNQSNRSRLPLVVPFRDSKLTRVLQGFFSGRGRSCMVVNINPCSSTYDETLQALKFSAIATQLVHGPSAKTHVAYIQSLLRSHGLQTNENAREEEEEGAGECSQEEEGDVTMFDPEELICAIEVLKKEVQRQREEKEELEARVREQVCGEMMEVIARMEHDFSETLESERALMEERHENKINNLQKSLKRFYTQEIQERDEQIERLAAELRRSAEAGSGVSAAPPDPETPRLSRRQASSSSSSFSSSSSSSSSSACFSVAEELSRVQAELDQCRSELLGKTQELRRYQGLLSLPTPSSTLTSTVERKLEEGQRCLRKLRLDLQGMGRDLQSAERTCCHSTSGERLRLTLANADNTLAKQDHALGELQNSLLLVKMDLRKKTDRLAQLKATPPPQAPPTPGSCTKRGLGAGGGAENHAPEKRPFLRTPLMSGRTPSRNAPATPATPNSNVPRSRHRSPPPVPALSHKSKGCVF
ncbi:kinesin-like protein KIF20A isoform X2 [Anguilla rostrata]